MPKDPVEVNTVVYEVRVVEDRGPSALVEYLQDGHLKRAVIPTLEIVDGAAPLETLEMGIPYGLPWEQIVTLSATSQALADELRRNDIWTLEDLERNPRAAYGAIQAVYGIDLAALLVAAHNKGGR